MFSSQINSRDLFFSNPADHFLGNSGGMKKSGESGINSNSYTPNTFKDFTGTNSQDLFSQSQKTNYGESQSHNADYKKYISQNLLFGKSKSNARKCNFINDEKDERECYSKISLSGENNNRNEANEVRNLMESLNDNITKLNTDVLGVKDAIEDMKVEITYQNKRIASFEDTVCNQIKCFEESDRSQRRSNKNDGNNITKLHNIITKNTEDIMQVLSRLEKSTDNYKTKTLESIKKFQTAQTNGNKKLLEDTKANNERILKRLDTKMDKNNNEFKNILNNIKHEQDNIIEEKLNNFKAFLENFNSSIKKLDDSKNNSILTSKAFRSPASVIQKSQHIAKSFQNLKPGPILRSHNNFHNRIPIFCNSDSIHTPLAKSINQNENSHISNYKENQNNPYLHTQQISTNFQTLKVKRKFSPSIVSNSTNFRNDKNIFTPKITSSSKLTPSKNTIPRQERENNSECLTTCSSPYYTIFERATKSEKYFM